MELKWTWVGLCIYAAMGLYAGAAALFFARLRRAAWSAYALGFAAAVGGWVLRWVEAGHVPMQNLFEVFLTLGALLFPITLLGRRFLGVGGEGGDAVIGLVVLVPAGLVFSADPQHLPPALQSWLFVPHVGAYMLAYVVMAKAAVQALGTLSVPVRLAMLGLVVPRVGLMLYLYAAGQHGTGPEAASEAAAVAWSVVGWTLAPATLGLRDAAARFFGAGESWFLVPGVALDLAVWALVVGLVWRARPLPMDRRLRAERDAYTVTCLGFPLLTLGLVLGAVWGKLAWGDYWNWDPKELWSLVSWLVFLGYLHFRYLYGRRFPRANAGLVLAGLVAIVLTLLWVNLARIFAGGLHSYAS